MNRFEKKKEIIRAIALIKKDSRLFFPKSKKKRFRKKRAKAMDKMFSFSFGFVRLGQIMTYKPNKTLKKANY